MRIQDSFLANNKVSVKWGQLQIANAIIYYNSAILSHLLTKCEASGNAKAVALITRILPAAWRHILLNGHYTFNSGGKMIALDVLLAGLDLG